MIKTNEMVNEKFYDDDKLFTVGFSLGNSGLSFEVWAQYEQHALEEVAEYIVKKKYEGLYYTLDDEDDMQDQNGEIEERFYQCDNGIFLDMDYLGIQEI